MMAEAGATQASLSLLSLPSEPDCFGSTVTSYSEGSATMDMCVKTEPDEENICQPAYCTEVLGSMLHVDTDHIKTEILLVKITEDNANQHICSNTERFCPESEQLSSSTGLLSKKYKSETNESIEEQHCQSQRCSCIEKEIIGGSHFVIKEEYADIQVNELSTFPCLLPKEGKSETDELKEEHHSQLQGPFSPQSAVDDVAHELLCGVHCGMDFSQPCHMKRHQVTHSSEEQYKCNKCQQSFSRADNLKQHQHFHSGEKTYKCNVCGKSFSQAGTLKHHQLVHTGEKPHKCIQCGKNFSRSNHLKVHQRVHSGEKPFKCSQCGRSFSRGSTLKQHWLVHSGEKPHKCSECGKSFSRGDNLKVHQLIHSGDKPYQCSECGKNFSHGGNLKKHQLTHSAEKPYKCSQCGKNFALRKYLKIHERTHSVLMCISSL